MFMSIVDWTNSASFFGSHSPLFPSNSGVPRVSGARGEDVIFFIFPSPEMLF